MDITNVPTMDVEIYASLFRDVFNQAPWNENWSLNSASARLNCIRNTPNFIGIAAHEGDILAGFIFGNYEPTEAKPLYLLKEMCIARQYQRSGLGTQLIQALHFQLSQKDIGTINLITRTDSAAERFYINNGYYPSSRMSLYVNRLSS